AAASKRLSALSISVSVTSGRYHCRVMSNSSARRFSQAKSARSRWPATMASSTSWTERSEEHTSELQSRFDLVCRLLLEKKKKKEETLIATDRSKRQKN